MTQAIDKNGLEAAAEAIDALWGGDDNRDAPFAELDRSYQQHCRSTAEAAIAAYLSASPQPQAHEAEPASGSGVQNVPVPRFEFDRYIDGQLMAEGVTIETATDLRSATVKAARIASRGSNGQVPVLVLSAAPAPAPSADAQVVEDMPAAFERAKALIAEHELGGTEDFPAVNAVTLAIDIAHIILASPPRTEEVGSRDQGLSEESAGAWRNTDEVIEAVRSGGECTDEELRYAVRNLSIWQNQMVFPLASAIEEDPVSPSTKRDLKRAWESLQGNKVPLDRRLKGGSFEPGLTQEERISRMASTTTDAAIKLVGALQKLADPSHE